MLCKRHFQYLPEKSKMPFSSILLGPVPWQGHSSQAVELFSQGHALFFADVAGSTSQPRVPNLFEMYYTWIIKCSRSITCLKAFLYLSLKSELRTMAFHFPLRDVETQPESVLQLLLVKA